MWTPSASHETVQAVEETLSAETCYAASIALDAADKCGNAAATKTVPVPIDLEDPVVSCTFRGAQHVTINQTGIGVLEELDLDYEATDNCGGPLSVTVSVFANEIEDFQSQKMALFYRNSDVPNGEADLYVATTTCTTAANGKQR